MLTCYIIEHDNMHSMLHVNIISQLGYNIVSYKQKNATIYYSLLNFEIYQTTEFLEIGL